MVKKIVLKKICKQCGYWDYNKVRCYKCYTTRCPAYIRDRDED